MSIRKVNDRVVIVKHITTIKNSSPFLSTPKIIIYIHFIKSSVNQTLKFKYAMKAIGPQNITKGWLVTS